MHAHRISFERIESICRKFIQLSRNFISGLLWILMTWRHVAVESPDKCLRVFIFAQSSCATIWWSKCQTECDPNFIVATITQVRFAKLILLVGNWFSNPNGITCTTSIFYSQISKPVLRHDPKTIRLASNTLSLALRTITSLSKAKFINISVIVCHFSNQDLW